MPIRLDLVQPDNEIMVISEKMPKKKAMVPTSLGNIKSLSATLNGNPSVVMSKSLVMAKMVTRKKLPAEVATISILFTNRV